MPPAPRDRVRALEVGRPVDPGHPGHARTRPASAAMTCPPSRRLAPAQPCPEEQHPRVEAQPRRRPRRR